MCYLCILQYVGIFTLVWPGNDPGWGKGICIKRGKARNDLRLDIVFKQCSVDMILLLTAAFIT